MIAAFGAAARSRPTSEARRDANRGRPAPVGARVAAREVVAPRRSIDRPRRGARSAGGEKAEPEYAYEDLREHEAPALLDSFRLGEYTTAAGTARAGQA